MGNRYSKTGFTARQRSTLESIRSDLARIYNDRQGKQDSTQALIQLLDARNRIQRALFLSEEWKND